MALSPLRKTVAPIEAGRATYQGYPVIAADFSVTPGMTADSGSVVMLIRNFSKVTFEIKRPMFSPARSGDESVATPENEDRDGVIDGAAIKFRQAGDLVFFGPTGTVKVTGVYIREDGVEEMEQFEGEAGGPEGVVSLVKIHLVDERIWWSQYGFVFATLNKFGVDHKVIPATADPETQTPWLLRKFLEIATQSIASNYLKWGDLHVSEDFEFSDDATSGTDEENGIEFISPRFQNPASVVSGVLEKIGLVPIRNIDGTFHVWERGFGKEVSDLHLPGQFIEHNLATISPDYTPDAVLVHAEFPTIVEEVWTVKDMVLRDPRDPATPYVAFDTVAKFYGFDGSLQSLWAFGKFAQMPDGYKQRALFHWIYKYLRRNRHLEDRIPDRYGAVPEAVRVQKAANDRASLLNQDMLRAFRVDPKDFAKLPLLPSLLRQEVFSPNSDQEPEEGEAPTDTIQNKPMTATFEHGMCRESSEEDDRLNAAGTDEEGEAALAADEEAPGTDETLKPSRRRGKTLFYNAVTTMSAVAGQFHVDPRAGILHFNTPIGPLYTGKKVFGKFFGQLREPPTKIADIPEGREKVREQFYRFAPAEIKLEVAYEKKGNRDLREAPGRDSTISRDVAAAALAHVSSPDDYFTVGYLRDNDEPAGTWRNVDNLYPKTLTLQGAREFIPLPKPGTAQTTERINKKLEAQAKKSAAPLFRSEHTITGRQIQVLGFYPIELDGIITQVRWSLDQEGTPRTNIVFGSMKTANPKGLNAAQKSLGWGIQRVLMPKTPPGQIEPYDSNMGFQR